LIKKYKFFTLLIFSIFGHQNPGSGSEFILKYWIRIQNTDKVVQFFPPGALPGAPDAGADPWLRGAGTAPAPGSAGSGPAARATGDPARRVARPHRQSAQNSRHIHDGKVAEISAA
jgi:hypothetical protein